LCTVEIDSSLNHSALFVEKILCVFLHYLAIARKSDDWKAFSLDVGAAKPTQIGNFTILNTNPTGVRVPQAPVGVD
jgi:hypothetical protein